MMYQKTQPTNPQNVWVLNAPLQKKNKKKQRKKEPLHATTFENW